jgi:hypothetical protein
MKRLLGISLLVAGLCGLLHGQAQAQSSGRFVLQIDGQSAGYLKSVEVGAIEGDLAATDTALALELGVTPAIATWLTESLSGEIAGSDLTIVEIDDDGGVVFALALASAHITEVSLPVFGGDKKDALSVTVQGRSVRTGDMTSEIELLDPGLSKPVATIQFKGVGVQKLVTPRDVASGLPTGKRQHKPFVIVKEAAAGSVAFQTTGLFKLTPDKAEAGSEQIRRVKAEVYCEEIRIKFDSAE